MLDTIRLVNFKNHRDTSIRLGRLTLLVGPNGAGKSGVLEAIDTTWRAFLEPERVTLNATARGLVRSGQPDFDLELNGTQDSDQDVDWTLRCRGPAPSIDFSDTSERTNVAVSVTRAPPAARESLGKVLRLHLSAQRLAAASALDSEHAQIDSEGAGLPSVSACQLRGTRWKGECLSCVGH